MNVTARLEYELANYDSAGGRFNHYTTRTPPSVLGMTLNFIYGEASVLEFGECEVHLHHLLSQVYSDPEW